MSKRLPVPADLEHLIEKRDDDGDRLNGERRKKSRATTAGEAAPVPEKRKQGDRRQKGRRKPSR
jgi:hypothetical protein